MEMTEHYANIEPSRAEVDALEGPVLLEFGTAWCGHCRAAQPLIGKALTDRSGIRHLKIEDGPGRPLGRSFRVKLWPTLILLDRGQELGRVVRPQDVQAIQHALGATGRPEDDAGNNATLRLHRQTRRGIIRRPVLQESWRVALCPKLISGCAYTESKPVTP